MGKRRGYLQKGSHGIGFCGGHVPCRQPVQNISMQQVLQRERTPFLIRADSVRRLVAYTVSEAPIESGDQLPAGIQQLNVDVREHILGILSHYERRSTLLLVRHRKARSQDNVHHFLVPVVTLYVRKRCIEAFRHETAVAIASRTGV